MKKLLVTSFISFALSASLAEAKFFIGVDVGYDYSKISPNLIANNRGDALWGSSAFYNGFDIQSWFAGVNLGTSHNITDNFGLRWLLGGNYAQAIDPKNTLQNIDLYLGVDTLFNFINTGSMKFGVIAGLEGNVSVYSFTNELFVRNVGRGQSSVGASARLGLGVELGEHNSLELLLRVPIVSTIFSRIDFGPMFYNPLRVSIGYKVLF